MHRSIQSDFEIDMFVYQLCVFSYILVLIDFSSIVLNNLCVLLHELTVVWFGSVIASTLNSLKLLNPQANYLF